MLIILLLWSKDTLSTYIKSYGLTNQYNISIAIISLLFCTHILLKCWLGSLRTGKGCGLPRSHPVECWDESGQLSCCTTRDPWNTGQGEEHGEHAQVMCACLGMASGILWESICTQYNCDVSIVYQWLVFHGTCSPTWREGHTNCMHHSSVLPWSLSIMDLWSLKLALVSMHCVAPDSLGIEQCNTYAASIIRTLK